MSYRARGLFAGALLSVVMMAVLEVGSGLAVVGDTKADQRLAPDEISLTGVAARLNFEPDSGRFSLHAALAEEHPGANFVIVSESDPVDRGHLLRVARGSEVHLAPADGREPLGRAVRALVAERGFVGLAARLGSVRFGGQWWSWELHVLDADARDFVIHAPGDLLVVADARLLPPEARAFVQRPEPDRVDPVGTMTPMAAGLVEAGLLFGILLLGGLLLPRELLAGTLRLPAALIVGLGGLGVTGSFVRGALLAPMLLLATAALHVLLLRRGHRPGWGCHDLGPLLLAAIALSGLSVAVRVLGLVHVSTDTMSYLDASGALAGSGPSLGGPSVRSPSLVAIHALGALAGVDGIFSLGPVVMLGGTLLLFGAALRGPRYAPAIAAGVMAVAMLATSGFVHLLTMLVNSHAYVSALLLLLAVLWRQTIADPSGRTGVGPAASLLAGAVALGRPEGAVIILLFLVGTLVTSPRSGWEKAWYAVGAVTLARALPLLDVSLLTRTSDLVLLALGTGALVAPLVTRRLPRGLRHALPWGLVAALWLALLASSGSARMPELIDNTRENLFTGAGGWGLAVPVLLVLLILVAALSGSQPNRKAWASLAPLATFVVGFVPAMLLVRAFGSDSAGRVHWHDSNNRMLLHLVPILLLFVVEAVRAWSDARRSGEEAAAGPALRFTTGAVVVVLALPALAWEPVFERESPRRAELLAEQPESLWKGDGLGGEAGNIGPILVGLEAVLASVPLDRDALSAGDPSRPGEVCVGVRLGTFGRPLSGEVEIVVASGRLESSGVADVQDLEDLERAIVCIALDEEQGGIGLLGDDALITIRGRGTLEGAAPAVMLDDAGAPVLSVDLSWFDAPRRDEPLVRLVPPVALLGVASLALLMLLAPRRPRRGALERT